MRGMLWGSGSEGGGEENEGESRKLVKGATSSLVVYVYLLPFLK